MTISVFPYVNFKGLETGLSDSEQALMKPLKYTMGVTMNEDKLSTLEIGWECEWAGSIWEVWRQAPKYTCILHPAAVEAGKYDLGYG